MVASRPRDSLDFLKLGCGPFMPGLDILACLAGATITPNYLSSFSETWADGLDVWLEDGPRKVEHILGTLGLSFHLLQLGCRVSFGHDTQQDLSSRQAAVFAKFVPFIRVYIQQQACRNLEPIIPQLRYLALKGVIWIWPRDPMGPGATRAKPISQGNWSTSLLDRTGAIQVLPCFHSFGE